MTNQRQPIQKQIYQGFLGGSVVKNLPASAEDLSLIPDPGRFHMPWGNQACVPQLLHLCSRAYEPQLLRLCVVTAKAQAP